MLVSKYRTRYSNLFFCDDLIWTTTANDQIRYRTKSRCIFHNLLTLVHCLYIHFSTWSPDFLDFLQLEHRPQSSVRKQFSHWPHCLLLFLWDVFFSAVDGWKITVSDRKQYGKYFDESIIYHLPLYAFYVLCVWYFLHLLCTLFYVVAVNRLLGHYQAWI